ncbi:MAG: pentapeptide repeat-containing protein [Thermodesulfobacteriota bacterium]|nr:pentapeptide repeat-containing protein [Thermodesulfobacteriota bacterium]
MEEKEDIRIIPKVELLFEENIKTFNKMVEEGRAPDLRNCNLSNLDLRNAKLNGLDLSGCYLRNTNLRGLDLTRCNLNGASLQGALISGAWFPKNISVDEIRLSVQFGTRLRANNADENLKALFEEISEIKILLKD